MSPAPTSAEFTQLTHTIAHRLARYLERDAEHGYLTLENSDEELDSGVQIPNPRAAATRQSVQLIQRNLAALPRLWPATASTGCRLA